MNAYIHSSKNETPTAKQVAYAIYQQGGTHEQI